MGKTFRKKDGINPKWIRDADDETVRRFYTDSFDHDGDKNPPKKFKQFNQRKFRHKVDQQLRQGEEMIEKDYKMPYWT